MSIQQEEKSPLESCISPRGAEDSDETGSRIRKPTGAVLLPGFGALQVFYEAESCYFFVASSYNLLQSELQVQQQQFGLKERAEKKGGSGIAGVLSPRAEVDK